MSTSGNTTGDSSKPSTHSMAIDAVVNVLLSIRSSFLLFVGVLGVVLILFGATILGGTGILAGMFGIWGISAILYAGIGLIFLRLIGYR